AGNSLTGTHSGNGAGLTSLTAGNISAGTAGISITGNAATATSASGLAAGTYANALTLSNAGNSFTGSGAGLNTLNASNISTGTLAVARGGTGLTTGVNCRAGSNVTLTKSGSIYTYTYQTPLPAGTYAV